MTAAAPTTHPTTVAPPGEAVVWAFDPWRERPRAAVAAALAAVVTCGLVLAAALPFLVGAALCLACVGTFAPAMMPVECRIDAERAGRRGVLGWESRAWAGVGRVDAVPAGVMLSPYARPHWQDATRGLLLPVPPARRAELLAAIAARHGAARG